MKLNYLLAGCLLMFAACSKTPKACFTTDKEKGNMKTNEEIKFSSCSTNADQFDWEFGDGENAHGGGSEVKHKYSKSGTYTVKLQASNKNKSDETSTAITIQ